MKSFLKREVYQDEKLTQKISTKMKASLEEKYQDKKIPYRREVPR